MPSPRRMTYAVAYIKPALRLPGGQNNLYPVCGVCPGMRGVAHSNRPCVLKHNGSVLIPDTHSGLYPIKDCRVISQSHLERIDSAAGLVHGGMGQLCNCPSRIAGRLILMEGSAVVVESGIHQRCDSLVACGDGYA